MSDAVMIHVRFAPDGTVVEIGERPPSLVPQAWFDILSEELGAHYRALAGGRGIFQAERALFEAAKAMVAM